jgi:SNF2 family DNA or RNA helicase
MKTKPMAHQVTALVRLEGKRNFALLMEQGTGKTWTTLADTERCYIGNKIDALLIVAPNGVHTNWIRREIPTHLEAPCLTYVWKGTPTTKKAKADWDKLYATHYPVGGAPLRVLSMNIEAINTPKGYEAAEEFLRCFRVMMVVDESTRIKNPSAKRTEKVIKLGRLATARRILTGTPITKAPTDLYSQFDFLKSGLLGTTSYRAFVAEHAVLASPTSPIMMAMMKKVGSKAAYAQVVEVDENGNKMWRNLDKLAQMIAPHSYRVRKEDCLDLPPKVYKTVYFELEAKQRQVYDRLKEDYHYVHMDVEDLSFQAIAARTKMKQVTSGFIKVRGETQNLDRPDDPDSLMDPKLNPRMAAFREIIEDYDGQFIVWAMYEEEINQIIAALEEADIPAVSYYGATSREARETAIDDFQAGKARAFVGHAQAAGIGLTLTAAELAIYYSCSFDNELRVQSEDRCHRIGTKHTVTYIDLVAEDTIDEDVVKSLAVKSAIADQIIDGRAA